MVSFGLIFLYLWAQTSSLWISAFGMLHIFLSFFITYFLYKKMILWFPFLAWLGLFVICGIGADVKQAATAPCAVQLQQLSYCTADRRCGSAGYLRFHGCLEAVTYHAVS